MLNCLVVGLGGAAGAVARYLIGLIPVASGSAFPYKTFIINILGAFAIGLLAAYTGKYFAADSRLLLFLKVGICGGFTTFSTFALESANLFADGRSGVALAYIIGSAVLGILAVFAAGALVK